MRVECCSRYLREALRSERAGRRRATICGYRGGYLPNERRAIERGLRDGAIRGVVATNALELGIDIGGLDAAVLTGYPGSLASLWQQFGPRGPQRRRASLAVLVASSIPLDQYVATNPDFVFGSRRKRGLIDPDNLLIARQPPEVRRLRAALRGRLGERVRRAATGTSCSTSSPRRASSRRRAAATTG